jgi:TetR/AcrR family transcriptional repressor of nem operon
VPPDPPRTAKAAETRRRILDVAAALFIAEGYSAVSTREIASAANLTHGALYGHFRSKGQLLVEAIRWKLAEREHTRTFTDSMDKPETGVDLIYDRSGREHRLLEIDAASAARHDPDVAAGLAELYADRHARIRASMSGRSDPEILTWLVTTLAAGVGARESAGVAMPDTRRVRSALLAVLECVS